MFFNSFSRAAQRVTLLRILKYRPQAEYMKAIIGFIILFTRLQEVYSSDNCHLQLLKECGKKVDAYENANVGAQGQQFIQMQCTLAQVNDRKKWLFFSFSAINSIQFRIRNNQKKKAFRKYCCWALKCIPKLYGSNSVENLLTTCSRS